MQAFEIIELLKLKPLPMEGGNYREIYKSSIPVFEMPVQKKITPPAPAMEEAPRPMMRKGGFGGRRSMMMSAQPPPVQAPAASAMPDPSELKRAATSIYYLLRGTEKSTWHKVASDEIWLYHGGSSAIQLLLFPNGKWEERRIGCDIVHGERPQSIIPAGTWQAAILTDQSEDSWGLFGAVVIPAFEFKDYSPGSGRMLSVQYPFAIKRMQELGLWD